MMTAGNIIPTNHSLRRNTPMNTMEKTHSHKHEQDDSGEHHPHKSQSEGEHNHDSSDHTHEHDGTAHSHDHNQDPAHKSQSEEEHTHTSGQQLRTDAQGKLRVDLPEDGIYYLRTIHMVEVADNDELTHQSKWATLTFQVSHKHDSSTHTHENHEHEDGIPTWGFVLGSLLVIGVLFLVFRKKK